MKPGSHPLFAPPRLAEPGPVQSVPAPGWLLKIGAQGLTCQIHPNSQFLQPNVA